MLKSANRSETDVLLEELANLESIVPPRARRFHELVTELADEVRQVKSRWSPLRPLGGRGGGLVSGGTPGELRARLDALRGTSEGIGELDRDAANLEAEIADLGKRAARLGDLEVSRFVRERSDAWTIRLAQVAAAAEPGWDPGPDQDFLDEAEEGLRLAFQALYWLSQLEEALDLFDQVPDGEARARDRIREELFARGADESGLLAARDLVDRVKLQAGLEKQKPREIGTVAELLPLLHRWSTELETLRDDVRQLDARHKKIVVEDWSTSLPKELLGEAQRLIQALTTRAREVRDEVREGLRGDLEELFEVCGAEPALSEGFAQLEAKEITRPEEHRHWLRDSARLRERMAALATTRRADLEVLLASRLDEVAGALAELRAEPLPDAVLARSRRIDHEAAALAEPAKAGDALRALDGARLLLAEVSDLRRQALAETEALRKDQAALRRDHEALRAEAARAGLEIPDLGGRIDELAVVDAATEGEGRSLEHRKRAATALAGELAAIREHLVDRCRSRLAEDMQSVSKLLEALLEVAPESVPVELPAIPHGAEPAAAVSAALEGAELVRSLESRARAVAELLGERRRQALDELREIDLEKLAPGDREASERLAGDLEAARPAGEPEALRRLGMLIDKVELLRERVEEDQRAVTERLAGLRRRLDAFLEDHLREHCPWLADRATALVYGLPDPPPATPDARRQLALAGEVLDKLEREARRLAAHLLVADVRRLEETARDPGSPGAARTEALLDELARHGHRALPPAVLRLKVRRMANKEAHRA